MSASTKRNDALSNAISRTSPTTHRWRWYHGVLFYIIAQVLSFGLEGLVTFASGRRRGQGLAALFEFDQEFYKEQKQPVFAPPPWLFAPAWTINNISVIYGNLRALNMPAGTPGRDAYLRLQALSWFDYVIFTAANFGLRSNINGAIVTLSMFGLTIASLFVSIFHLKDTRIALSLATLFTWLIVASSLSTCITLWNRDEFYRAGPFAKPGPALLKRKA